MRKSKQKPRFFPFSPGIPWYLEKNKYISQKIDFNAWHDVLSDKEIVVTVPFGGLIESFFSLCAIEAISLISKNKISWIGNDQYSSLIRYQGLCNINKTKITDEILSKYPVPLFLDGKNNAYLNLMYNYLIRRSYWGSNQEEVKSPIFEQLSKNILMPWNNSFLPKLRNLGTDYIEELYRSTKIKQSSKLITIVLNDTQNDILQWSIQNFKEFAQLASHKHWKVIIFTNNKNRLYGQNIISVEYNLRHILQTINKSWILLSNDINWLLLSLLFNSNIKIISKPSKSSQFDLFGNAEFLGSTNDIFTDCRLSPIDAFGICEVL